MVHDKPEGNDMLPRITEEAKLYIKLTPEVRGDRERGYDLIMS